jgi:ABC-2 type transport system permease protein
VNRRALALVLDPLRATWRGGAVWAASIAALVIMTVAFWPAFEGATELGRMMEEMIAQIPAGLVEAFGLADFGTPAGYLRGQLYELLMPLVFGAAAIAFASGLTAGEEDAGRLELVLAGPVSRGAVFLGRTAAMLGWMGILVAVTAVVQVASNTVFGLEIALDRLLATIALCGLLGILHGCLALAVAGFRPRPSVVIGVGVVALIAGFVVVALFPLSDPLRDWAGLSPWDWALGGDPLVHGAEPWRYTALVIPSAGLAAIGLVGFLRRDVRSA